MSKNTVRVELGGDEAVIEVNGVRLHNVRRIVIEHPAGSPSVVDSVEIEFDVSPNTGLDDWGGP